MEFTGIAQEVRVWAAMKETYVPNAYEDLAKTLPYSDVVLPNGTVTLIANETDEDGDKGFIIFNRVNTDKLYRIDANYDSWSDHSYEAPYEVEAKQVTETKYLRKK
jgi:hypothetical protein